MNANKLLEWGIEGLLKVEPLDDEELKNKRYDTCKACPSYKPELDTCTKCKCYMRIKTKLRYNHNPLKQFRVELTHCPDGLWGDKDIANLYRERDGKELLT